MSASLYESHVTVRCAGPDEEVRLRRWAAAAGLKLTHIVLARGRMREQPMLTLSGSSSYVEQAARARGVVAGLRADGFAPVRVKTESTPWAPEVPARLGEDDERYFEHHVKLLLDADTDLAALAARVVPLGAHLSWNALRVRAGARHERFVTQRCRSVGADGAGRALQRLLTELDAFVVLGVEREFVLHDSDLSVDDGWIEESVGGVAGAARSVRDGFVPVDVVAVDGGEHLLGGGEGRCVARLSRLGSVLGGSVGADHLDAGAAQLVVCGEGGLGGGQVAQAPGQFEGAFDGQ